MDGPELNEIFLSASIPVDSSHQKYSSSADVVAIRDAVRALATVVIPKSRLIWGGHPSITPLIRYVMGRMKSNLQKHIMLYQSNFYRDDFTEDIHAFEHVEIVPESVDEESSVAAMRSRMMNAHNFKAGIFIGGMDGVEKEFHAFRESHPSAMLLPVASTGAAAKIIYETLEPKPNERLLSDYAYMAMFKDLLSNCVPSSSQDGFDDSIAE